MINKTDKNQERVVRYKRFDLNFCKQKVLV